MGVLEWSWFGHVSDCVRVQCAEGIRIAGEVCALYGRWVRLWIVDLDTWS